MLTNGHVYVTRAVSCNWLEAAVRHQRDVFIVEVVDTCGAGDVFMALAFGGSGYAPSKRLSDSPAALPR